ncbi:acyltransferase [Planctomycetota bacterium]
MLRLRRKIFNIARYVWNYLKYRPRFYYFGWRSVIERPDMLTNPKAVHIGNKVHIRKASRIEAVGRREGQTPKIVIGDNTSIHLYFHCGAAESVVIGKNVLIAGRVYISDHDHVYDEPGKSAGQCEKLLVKPVVIEDSVWLGEGCVILKGVTVGKRAVVGANAVVTKDVPAYTVVGGIPARIIKEIEIKQ